MRLLGDLLAMESYSYGANFSLISFTLHKTVALNFFAFPDVSQSAVFSFFFLDKIATGIYKPNSPA